MAQIPGGQGLYDEEVFKLKAENPTPETQMSPWCLTVLIKTIKQKVKRLGHTSLIFLALNTNIDRIELLSTLSSTVVHMWPPQVRPQLVEIPTSTLRGKQRWCRFPGALSAEDLWLDSMSKEWSQDYQGIHILVWTVANPCFLLTND